jgi:hypothetical protein
MDQQEELVDQQAQLVDQLEQLVAQTLAWHPVTQGRIGVFAA